MKITLLGTGTSHGVPVIGCKCPVCTSKDQKDKRYRCSAFLESEGKKILIDCGPEFRLQALEHNICSVDAVLLTHSHADHLHGIDDLRIFSLALDHAPETEDGQRKVAAPPLPIYANASTIEDMKYRFAYIFAPAIAGGGHAKLNLIDVSSAFKIGKTQITPIPMLHGKTNTTGWLISEVKADGKKHSAAYLTDCNYIEQASINLINENAGILDQLIIDGLRIKEHSTHFNIKQALEAAEKLSPKNVWIIHLTHNNSHKEYTDYINSIRKNFPGLEKAEMVAPAYDGLVLTV